MMDMPALAAQYARVSPKKTHVALPILIMAALFWVSSLPGTLKPGDPGLYVLFYWISPSLQNALHIPVYAILACAWHWALRAWLGAPWARTAAACVLTSLFGVFDEWNQSFVPGRYGSLTDVVLDVTGAVLGSWLGDWMGAKAITSEETRDTIKRG
jgi:hypothetical protein